MLEPVVPTRYLTINQRTGTLTSADPKPRSHGKPNKFLYRFQYHLPNGTYSTRHGAGVPCPKPSPLQPPLWPHGPCTVHHAPFLYHLMIKTIPFSFCNAVPLYTYTIVLTYCSYTCLYTVMFIIIPYRLVLVIMKICFVLFFPFY